MSASTAAAALAAAAQSNNLFDGDGLFFYVLQTLTREQLKEVFDALHMVCLRARPTFNQLDTLWLQEKCQTQFDSHKSYFL